VYSSKLIDIYKDFLANGTDTLWNNWNKVSGTGESLTLNNTIQAKMKIDLKGNTSQEGTPTPDSPQDIHVVSGDNTLKVEGKNLFNKDTSVQGYIRINNGTINPEAGNHTSDFIEVNPSTNYVRTTREGNAFYDENKTFISYYYGENITTPNNAKYLRITVKDNYLNDEQLEKGSTATEYEPYQSTNYPIYLGVENLLENNATTQTISGVSFTKNSDGTITANGTATAQILYVINSSVSMTGNYVLSGSPTTSQDSTYFLQLYGTGGANDYGNGVSISNFNGVIRIVVRNGAVLNNVIFKPQIEKGTKKSSYTPYGTTPIELCKIGDYQDSIVKDNGKWYLNKQIGKVVLDGSEAWQSWAVQETTNLSHYILDNAFIYNKTSGMDIRGICDNYVVKVNGKPLEVSLGLRQTGDTLNRIYLTTLESLNTLELFKTYLSTHNATLYYVLATPTYTEITDSTLISQLEAIKLSYNGQTNISQTNTDKPFILDVTALGELEI
jgi:hypothetical protein